jgi:hypothetical protein
LADPDGHRVGIVPCTANVEERLDGQHRIYCDVPDPAVLPSLLQMLGEVRSFECPSVVTLPNVRIALRIAFARRVKAESEM